MATPRSSDCGATESSEEQRMASEKMISRKDGGVGWMIFNNPERHNAISLEM